MSSLRPLVKPQLILAQPKSAGRPPKLAFLPLSKLRIDDTYQRAIERRGLNTIARIHNEFDWNRFAPLIVAPVPGKGLFVIIDGQHRATAALLRGLDMVPCSIVDAQAREQAGIFAAVNGNVTPVSKLQLFKAGLAARTPWAVEIEEVCNAAGLVPLTYPKSRSEIKPFQTMAIGTLQREIRRYGVAELTDALRWAVKQPQAAEPGYWNSDAIVGAGASWREMKGKRKTVDESVGQASKEVRIRDLKKRGYSRSAIAAATGFKWAEIEEALKGMTA